jgi:hypothetical protein
MTNDDADCLKVSAVRSFNDVMAGLDPAIYSRTVLTEMAGPRLTIMRSLNYRLVNKSAPMKFDEAVTRKRRLDANAAPRPMIESMMK